MASKKLKPLRATSSKNRPRPIWLVSQDLLSFRDRERSPNKLTEPSPIYCMQRVSAYELIASPSLTGFNELARYSYVNNSLTVVLVP